MAERSNLFIERKTLNQSMTQHESEESRMRAIFISYRREDSEGQAGRLFDDLARHFGKDAVFMDVAGIEPGRDFRRVIDEHVASCGVLLAVIGKSWIDVTDETGRRRLEDPMDFVRLETASALKRDISVVPVLVHGARMPRAEQLPEDLAELAFRNGVELTHARWDSDVQVLIKALSPHVESLQTSERQVKALDRVNAPAAPSADTSRITCLRRTADIDPPAAAPAEKKFFTMIVAGSVAALVIAGGGYLAYRNAVEKAEIARVVNLQRIAAETAKMTAEKEKLSLEVARQRAEAGRVAAEKAKAAEAETIAAERARQRAETDRMAAERTKMETERLAFERAKKRVEDDARVAVENAEKERRQTEAERIASERAKQRAEAERIAAEKANAAEAEKIALEKSKQAAAQRGCWPSYRFPPPNGGLLVYTIMPDGNPACASYDGGGCLWGQTYDQIDFRRLRPLVCGAQHRARWGVTGYENAKHWCTLARRMRADLR